MEYTSEVHKELIFLNAFKINEPNIFIDMENISESHEKIILLFALQISKCEHVN